jgi:putative ABC transport system substrate-binding protein
LRGAKDRGAQAVFVWPGGFAFSFARQISDAANLNGLPSIHPYREGALAGGLLAYTSDLKDLARRGAVFVDKILKGTSPGDIPVEQPIKIDPIINLKTARALGLTLPPTLLVAATEVIE